MDAAAWINQLTTVTPDFPEPGVLFRDLTPVFAHPIAWDSLVTALSEGLDCDAVAGIDARGFLLAGAVAHKRGLPVVLLRKAGKLPPPVLREEYELEYGVAALEVRADLLASGSRVLIVDDVLATGGTIAAAIGLVHQAHWRVAAVSVALEITDLRGRSRLPGITLRSLVQV